MGGNVYMCWVCCNPYVVLFWEYAHMETLTFPNHERNANQTFPLLSTPVEIRHPSIHAHTALTSASRDCPLWESGLGMTYSQPLACLWSLLVSCYLSLLQYFLLFIFYFFERRRDTGMSMLRVTSESQEFGRDNCREYNAAIYR